MLQDFSRFSSQLGGLEFYGQSTEFRDLLQVCRDFASSGEARASRVNKVYLFIEDYHGKSSLAKATLVEAATNGIAVDRLDGTAGASLKILGELQQNPDAVVVVDGVAEVAAQRSNLLNRFNALKGRGLLFAPPEYLTDANLHPDILQLKLEHVDQRPIDKLAWLIGLVREYLRDETGIIPPRLSAALLRMPLSVLLALCRAPLGPKISEIRDLAGRIAQAIDLRVNLRPDEAFPQEELTAIVIDFYCPTTSQMGPGFRLWVEGDSDCRMLKLVSRLAVQGHGVDLERGLAILPLGEGREGGTSRAAGVVFAKHTRRNKDIFLFDSDEPARHAQRELEVLDQEVVLLDPRLACCRGEQEVETEDFISLSCLDRFYAAHPDLRPEKEVIRYKPPASRRLVIDGVHKEALINWLEENATLADLENLVFVLCDIRSRFSLQTLPVMDDRTSWRKKLAEEFNPGKHVGKRPGNWSV